MELLGSYCLHFTEEKWGDWAILVQVVSVNAGLTMLTAGREPPLPLPVTPAAPLLSDLVSQPGSLFVSSTPGLGWRLSPSLRASSRAG